MKRYCIYKNSVPDIVNDLKAKLTIKRMFDNEGQWTSFQYSFTNRDDPMDVYLTDSQVEFLTDLGCVLEDWVCDCRFCEDCTKRDRETRKSLLSLEEQKTIDRLQERQDQINDDVEQLSDPAKSYWISCNMCFGPTA